MIIHREIGSSYHHKPIVQGVDYSPPHDDEQRGGVGEGGEAAGGDSDSGSPSNLPPAAACRLSVLVFFYLRLAHLRDRGRDPFYRWF